MSDQLLIGAVLTYRLKGTGRPFGQQMGADGGGEYAYVIKGDTNNAYQWAQKHVHRVMESRAIIEDLTIVTADEGYYGPSLHIVDLNNET